MEDEKNNDFNPQPEERGPDDSIDIQKTDVGETNNLEPKEESGEGADFVSNENKEVSGENTENSSAPSFQETPSFDFSEQSGPSENLQFSEETDASFGGPVPNEPPQGKNKLIPVIIAIAAVIVLGGSITVFAMRDSLEYQYSPEKYLTKALERTEDDFKKQLEIMFQSEFSDQIKKYEDMPTEYMFEMIDGSSKYSFVYKDDPENSILTYAILFNENIPIIELFASSDQFIFGIQGEYAFMNAQTIGADMNRWASRYDLDLPSDLALTYDRIKSWSEPVAEEQNEFEEDLRKILQRLQDQVIISHSSSEFTVGDKDITTKDVVYQYPQKAFSECWNSMQDLYDEYNQINIFSDEAFTDDIIATFSVYDGKIISTEMAMEINYMPVAITFSTLGEIYSLDDIIIRIRADRDSITLRSKGSHIDKELVTDTTRVSVAGITAFTMETEWDKTSSDNNLEMNLNIPLAGYSMDVAGTIGVRDNAAVIALDDIIMSAGVYTTDFPSFQFRADEMQGHIQLPTHAVDFYDTYSPEYFIELLQWWQYYMYYSMY